MKVAAAVLEVVAQFEHPDFFGPRQFTAPSFPVDDAAETLPASLVGAHDHTGCTLDTAYLSSRNRIRPLCPEGRSG